MRKSKPKKRYLLPDPKFKDALVTKFVNYMMEEGKKSLAYNIFYDAIAIVEKKAAGEPGLEIWKRAMSHRVSLSDEAIIIRLGPGKSITDVSAWVEQGMQSAPPGMPLAGVSPLSKGRSATFPVLLTAGTYGLICFLPDAKDGKQHDKHGMLQQFEVAAR